MSPSVARVLQRIAVCCSVLQCVAVCCSALQCIAACCSVIDCRVLPVYYSVLQYIWHVFAVCCSALQCVAVWHVAMRYPCSAVYYSVLTCAAVCSSVLQRVAVCSSATRRCALPVYYSVLQRAAVCLTCDAVRHTHLCVPASKLPFHSLFRRTKFWRGKPPVFCAWSLSRNRHSSCEYCAACCTYKVA